VLDVTLHELDGVSLSFPKSTHTALVGSGASQLLRKIAGDIRTRTGSILIGARDVTALRPSRRPLLYATRDIDAPPRWSVRHLLVAAVRQRTLDRTDRQREFEFVVSKWSLDTLLDRTLKSLSDGERTVANIARIELLKPGILLADGVVDRARVAPEFYRLLRILGATVISVPATLDELGFTDRVVVLNDGQVVQQGTFSQVYRAPVSVESAKATGDVNLIPITIRANEVQSPIGTWTLEPAPFQGDGVALARPEQFMVAEKGGESDFIFGIEEASFHGDQWRATGFLTGNLTLTVALPPSTELHKGRLLPLRYDPNAFTLFKV
jgi:ABC-type sugar transport system ATPase subunit